MAAVHPSPEAALFDDSGRFYRLIADTIPLMVWGARADGAVDYVNRRVLEYTGLSAHALFGWGWDAVVHPDDRERCAAAWRRALEHGERSENEMRLRRADGEYRWHHGSGVPVRAADGRLTRWIGICTDIDEDARSRREVQQALLASERRFQLFLDYLPASAWIRDADFRYTYVNRRYTAEWGVEPAAVLGREATEFFPPDIAEHFRETDRKVAREGVPLQFTDALPSGRWLKMKFPVPDGRGGVGVAGIALDIAERSRLEQALSESERRFQLFMQHVPAPAWVKDQALRYTYVNRAYEEVYGRPAAEVLGRTDFDLHAAERAAYLREEDERIMRSGEATQRAHEMSYADGRPGHWLVTKFPLGTPAGQTGVGGMAIDITERNRLEEALRASEQRFRAFMQHAPARAWIKDSRLRYTYVNAAFARDHGRAEKDYIGRDDFEVFPERLARYFREHDEKVVRGEPPAQELRQFVREDGAAEHWLVAKFPLADESGATGLAAFAIDVSDRIDAERKAKRYAEEVRDLVGRLVQAQEAERRRVADGLHDLIGQNLTALGIDLQALRQSLGAAGEGAAGARLDAMASLLDTTIDAIRGVMTDLRPTALEEFGLVPALRWYASQFARRTGLKASTKAPRREVRLAPEKELALFRIAQEALTNAAKHSGAGSVEVRIRYGSRVILTVQDDGRGFADPVGARAARRGGFGLTTMRERAEAHGGTLRIEFPGRGTRVVAEIPGASDGD